MKISHNINARDISSMGVGGMIKNYVQIESSEELLQLLNDPATEKPLTFLGSGTNVVISDNGINGTVVTMTSNNIDINEATIIADAGVSWDALVQKSLELKLWGLELMSGIPGSVGAAIFGNIAAYGQAVADTLTWVDCIDTSYIEPKITRIEATALDLKYRWSNLQLPENKDIIILRACFELSKQKNKELEYQKALSVANELNLDPNSLEDRRTIIMEARRQAGSLITDPSSSHKTAGSFFKNPIVNEAQVDKILEFDETGVKKEDLLKQNLIHGGSSARVSAALVMLAAGYKRGRQWGNVRLHPDHVLKVENTGDASAQEIYDVVQEIIHTVDEKLGIKLEPEVRFIGFFS